MMTLAATVAWMALAVDAGWQPADGGGLEYVVHLDPAAAEALARGEEIASDVPPALAGVKTVRIRVSRAPAPREGEPVTAQRPPAPPAGTPLQRSIPAPGPGASDEPLPEDSSQAWYPSQAPLVPLGSGQPLAQSGFDPATATPALPDPSTWIGTLNRLNPQNPSPIQPTVGAVTRLPPVTSPAVPTSLPESGPQATIRQDPLDASAATGGTSDARREPADERPTSQRRPEERPWGTLLAAMLGLFASVGGNLYLGWTNWSTRLRYRQLLERVRHHTEEQHRQVELERRATAPPVSRHLASESAVRRDRR